MPTGLLWTERLVLLSYLSALTIVTCDAVFELRLRLSVLKHIPLMLFVPSFILHFVGVYLFRSQQAADREIFKLTWPLLLLSAFAFTGSLIARSAFDVVDTFLTLGIYTLAPYIFARVIATSENWRKLLVLLALFCGLAGLCIAIAVFRDFASSIKAPIHEKEWFVITPLVFWLMLKPRRWWQILLAMLCVGAAVLGRKNTGYLVLLVSLAYFGLWYLRSYASSSDLARAVRVTIVAVFALVVCAAVVFLWLNRQTYLPSGNVEYRLFQYSIALEEFLESPLWGHAFLRGSGQEFTLWVDPNFASMNLPTHNDVLDIAKAGGLIALALWFYGLLRVLWPAWRLANTPGSDFDTASVHFLILSSIGAVVVYSFNPILLSPCPAFIVWCNFGALAGVLVRRAPSISHARSNQHRLSAKAPTYAH